MHGLINRAYQCFVCDTYGLPVWDEIMRRADLGYTGFEAMMTYDDRVLIKVIGFSAEVLSKTRASMLEDAGTYMISHSDRVPLRRLLRFGGTTFADFLHSLDDLPDWARLAVPDLELPELELRELADDRYRLAVLSRFPGFGYVALGVLRAMADDYGALVFLEMERTSGGADNIVIQLFESGFSEGRSFDLSEMLGAS
jgi:hypothetical protein